MHEQVATERARSASPTARRSACTAEYAEAVRTVAQSWNGLELEWLLNQWSEQIDEAFREDGRREGSVEEALAYREIRREIVHNRARTLFDALDQHDSE